MIERFFTKWKNRQSHITSLHMAASKVRGQMAEKSRAAAFLHWKYRYQERKMERNHQQKLVAKAWLVWKTSHSSRQRENDLRGKRESRHVAKCFQALKNWARARSGRRIILQGVESRNNHFTLKVTFTVWREASRKVCMAKDHNNHSMQRRAFVSWQHYNQRQKALSSLLHEAASRVDRRRLQEAFRIWKQAYSTARRNQAKVEAFVQRREDLLLCKCFSQWRDELHEQQAWRLRERRLMRWGVERWRRCLETRRLIRQYDRELEELANLYREHTLRRRHFNKWRAKQDAAWQERRTHFLQQKYGLIWKRIVSQRLMAQAVARFWSLQRSWTTWRRNFIREQVSRRMLKQDQKLLLAKVFHKWRQLTQPDS